MKCFHFTNGERREDDDGIVSKAFKVSWAHSFSIASSTAGTMRANDLRVFSFLELKSATRGFNKGLMVGGGGMSKS
ncbi:hypothetical protein NL676_025671 [Syzygium grande]|nr:hypothetical protein NL676_025671 [Syzygium grande]